MVYSNIPFLLFQICKRNKLDVEIRNTKKVSSFSNYLSKIGRHSAKQITNTNNLKNFKFLTRLRLGLSHLKSHRFTHNFLSCINPLCSCSSEIESLSHFFVLSLFYKNPFNPFRWISKNKFKCFNSFSQWYESEFFYFKVREIFWSTFVKKLLSLNSFINKCICFLELWPAVRTTN